MDHRREIDGLRAVAVLPVILFHAGFAAFRGGFVGVDVFFVISGYLITTILLADIQAGRFSLVKFYERRARRILPALFLVILACVPFAWRWMMPQDLKSFSQSVVAVCLFSSNVLFWLSSGYFDTNSDVKPLLHTWSLAVEEQYYLLFPLLLLATRRLGRRWTASVLAILFLASLAMAQRWSAINPTAGYYLLPSRGWELLVGGFAAFYFQNRSPRTSNTLDELAGAAGLALIVYSVVAFDKYTPFPSVYSLAPTMGALLIILFASRDTHVGRVLGSRIPVGIGLISYSAYLWHQPLFAFARYRSLDVPGPLLLGSLSVVALLLACVSWKYIEVPFRNPQLLSRRAIFSYAGACSVLFIAAGLIGEVTKGFPARTPPEALAVLRTAEQYALARDDGTCNVPKRDFELLGCTWGDPAAVTHYALIGDSHASVLVHELSDAFTDAHLSFKQYTKDSCGFAFGLMRAPPVNCDKFQQRYLADLREHPVDGYIVAARWSYYPDNSDFDNGDGGFEERGIINYTAGATSFSAPYAERRQAVLDAYRASLLRLIAEGKQVVLVYPIPEQGWDIPKMIARVEMFGTQLGGHSGTDAPTLRSVRSDSFRQRNSEVVALLDGLGEHSNLVRIRPGDLLCDTFVRGHCASQIDGVPLYYDDDHLSDAGARLVVAEIMKHTVSKNAPAATGEATMPRPASGPPPG